MAFASNPLVFALRVVCGSWFMVFASFLIMAASGATYIFAVYSKDIKSAFGYDQQSLNTVAFFKDVGSNVGILAGLINEIAPPWLVLSIGSVMNLFGYLMLYLSITGHIPWPALWQAASDWLFSYPPGIREILHYIKNRYNHPIIYITENGISSSNNATLPLEEALKDDERIDYHREHLSFVNRAIKEGVDVRGYFAWSLLDNFEWSEGYTVRFGINYVDFKNDLKRYPKSSALWFRKFLKR